MSGLRGWPLVPLAVLAGLLTALNAAKPMTADDVSYWLHARQIAAHPFDPYGGRLIWDAVAMPTLANIAPPVLPAWVAGAIAIAGEDPLIVKLSLLPVLGLLSGAVWWLLRRFAAEPALLLTWAALLSPGVLPGINLMLDVPALALTMAAVAVFIAAADRDSWRLAVGAGLLGALAMQTKWTGVSAPCAMAAYALTHRRVRIGMLGAGAAAAGFLLVEAVVASRYGNSVLLFALSQRQTDPAVVPRWELLLDLPVLIGVTSPVLLPLAALALDFSRTVARMALVGMAGSFAWVPVPKRGSLWLHMMAFAVSGALPLAAARRALARPRVPGLEVVDADTLFLRWWLAAEILTCLVLSPYPAARRVLGIGLVLLIVIGRRLPAGRRAFVAGAVGASIAAGLAVWSVERHDAASGREAVTEARAWLDARDAGGARWALGSWGFHFYSERAGFGVVTADESVLRPGDWIVVAANSIANTHLEIDPAALSREASWVVGPEWPVATMTVYYSGWLPFDVGDGRTQIQIYRVVAETVPRRRP